MNSEKVKEIKKVLECCKDRLCEVCPRLKQEPNQEEDCRLALIGQALTLINELESENSKFKDFMERNEWESIEDMETTLDKAQQKCFEVAKENQQLKDRIADLNSKNEKRKKRNDDIKSLKKKLRKALIKNEFWESVFYKINEDEYRKKFNDEWRKEYQLELDKQGNGKIAGYPDSDLVYKLYFEQKDRIAELEEYIKGNEQDAKAFVNSWHKDLGTELKQFAEKVAKRLININGIKQILDETLKEFINE